MYIKICFNFLGLALEAALKMTKTELDLLTDLDMHMLIESGIRGGVSITSHRYARCNLPGIEGYDSSKPNEYLVYLDGIYDYYH